MLRVGLTGSIAAGKSTVLDMIAAQGVPVFSSDTAVHELYRGAAVPAVEALFPGVTRDGAIDRTELSRRLVADPSRLTELEAAVHPLVRERIAAFLATAKASGARLAVVDIPLLYERGIDWGFDRIIVVAVDEAEQRRRAMARPGMTVEKLDAILARQLPQSEKIKRADHVVDTSESLEATRRQVMGLLAVLTEEADTTR
jgi:dephospho-CoA kinase